MLSSIATQLHKKLCQESAKEQLALAVGAGGLLLPAVPVCSDPCTAPYPVGQGPQIVTTAFIENAYV